MNIADYLAYGKKPLLEKVNDVLKKFRHKEVPLLEMSNIDGAYNNRKGFYGNKKYKLYVYSEKGSRPPHFHIIDSKTNGKMFNMKIRIKDLTIMSVKDVENNFSKSSKDIPWDGYNDIRKKLIEYLKDINTIGLNNYVSLVNTWNNMNSHNEVLLSNIVKL